DSFSQKQKPKEAKHTPKSATNSTDITQQSSSNSSQNQTKILIINGDTLYTAFYLIDELHVNPVVLNMASMSHPGGGYLSGAAAQEENLFRRTKYVPALINM